MEGVISHKRHGSVVKRRNSSGCLIVRRREDVTNSSGPKKVLDSKKGIKKRLTVRDSGSSYGISGADFVDDSMPKLKKCRALATESWFGNKTGVHPPPYEVIRLQGKNGVLRVTVNDKNRANVMQNYHHYDSFGGESLVRISSHSERKINDKYTLSRIEKTHSSVKKRVPTKKTDIEDSVTSLKSPLKERESQGEFNPPSENLSESRCREGKVKRCTGAEKQLLRDQIRKMLLDAGWKIDLRPRRNRDYLDSVYISPTGTGYWSIVKAYDALQKQLVVRDKNLNPHGECSPFSPISEEAITKLTRQTRKKIEKDQKCKVRCDEEKQNCFIGRNVNSTSDMCTGTATPDSHLVHRRKSRTIGRCTLLIRSSNLEIDGFVPYEGKRTVLSWMIDSGTVRLSEKVQYMNQRQTRAMLEGWITRDGIHCGCCSKILTISKFEIHAGSKLRLPFQHIFTESRVSLLQCLIEALNRQEGPECSGFHSVNVDDNDPSDDTCGICGDGGDLICCDSCPSTFHLSCLHIQNLPPGDWKCHNCSCKSCGVNDENHSQGNDTPESPPQKCSLCGKRYHDLCVSRAGVLPMASNSSIDSFCGHECQELYDHLEKFIGIKHELGYGFSWSLIHRTNLGPETSDRGFSEKVECNSKLAVALSIMDECFLPIVDRRGGVDVIRHVLYNYGSNFSRLDYSGFYTAILERGDEIISAASIRFHGKQLAEMPFIGTRHIYRRQGMCRRLFSAVEMAAKSLKVEKLIIPAIPELMHTWTKAFGFKPLEDSDKQAMGSINLLSFPDTDKLQKLLSEQQPVMDGINEKLSAVGSGISVQIIPSNNTSVSTSSSDSDDATSSSDLDSDSDISTSSSDSDDATQQPKEMYSDGPRNI